MIGLNQLSKSFGAQTLFEDVTLNLNPKDRVALIGPNGSGKSTLLKILTLKETFDHGDLLVPKGTRIGYLSQDLPKFENRTVLDEVISLGGVRDQVLQQKAELEEALGKDPSSESVLLEYSRVLEVFETFDEYRLPSLATSLLIGLGFQQEDLHRPLSEFSGGYQMRALLARILLENPDLLILDEPTNHLDLESILWLEEYLRGYPGALLLVSHDRAFSNRIVNRVWEISNHKINSYTGNQDAYEVQREERLRVLMAEKEKQDASIAHLQEFVDRFGAKASKATQAQSRQKQIEKLKENLIELPTDRATVGFRFPPCPPSGKDVLMIKGAKVQFQDHLIFKDFDFHLTKGAKVAIVGKNGAGKTTLLKSIAGDLSLTSGEIRLGHEVRIGYYSQHQAEKLNLNSTILDELERTAPHLETKVIRGLAGAFLFTGDSVFKPIRVLSGGEKARVALAKLLLTPNNLLILDEPTNHLDQDSKQVLLEALKSYEGTLIVVSHDRDFLNPLAKELLEIRDQKVNRLVIPYSEYISQKVNEAKTLQKVASPKPESAKPESTSSPTTPLPEVKKDRPSNNQLQAWKKELQKIEADLPGLESEQAELLSRLSNEDFTGKDIELRSLIEKQTNLQGKIDAAWERMDFLMGQLGQN